MLLGFGHPVWTKLYDALARLAEACGGPFAFVIDEGNGLWCIGIHGSSPTAPTDPEDRPADSFYESEMVPRLSTDPEDRAADRFYQREMVPRMAAIRKGRGLDVARTEGDDCYAAISFAGIYAVVVWFDGAFDPTLVRTTIRRALPEIEALTLALPPSGGPGTDEGAMKMRA